MMKKMNNHPFVDIDKADQAGATPLHWACKAAKMRVIKFLFQHHDVDPVKPDHKGNTPLHVSIACPPLSNTQNTPNFLTR